VKEISNTPSPNTFVSGEKQSEWQGTARNACGHSLLTKSEIANRLRKTTRTVDTWMAAGILPHLKIGRSVLFDWDDVQHHLNEYFRVSRFNSAPRKLRTNESRKEVHDQ
jgi:excisionase family DNA binding protein